MLKQNSELRAEARAALTDKWVMAAIATLISQCSGWWIVCHSGSSEY